MEHTTAPITYATLLRKYGGLLIRAHELELKAARKAVPEGVPPMRHLEFAVHNYMLECKRKHKHICTNRDGLCEEDKCNCR